MARAGTIEILLPKLESGARAAADEEAYVDGSFADDDGVGVRKMTPVDVDAEIAGFESGERPQDAALKLIPRRSRSDRLAHRKRDDFANAQRRRKRKGRRPLAGDGVKIERHANANHADILCPVPRSRLPTGSTVETMSHFGNVPAHTLADAVEKHVARMSEADLASILRDGAETMPLGALHALVASILDAFRDRGESSDDVAEGSRTQLERIEAGDRSSIRELISYASENTALLKEAVTIFAQENGAYVSALPQKLVDGISGRLSV